jgi:hypothetical protein
MWIRRLLRRRRKPPPLDLSGLERVEELIARVVDLVPQVAGVPGRAEPPAKEPRSEPALDASPASHLLLFPGYTLVARAGPAPERGRTMEHEGAVYTVLRLGPSPLPGDRRRCAFLT